MLLPNHEILTLEGRGNCQDSLQGIVRAFRTQAFAWRYQDREPNQPLASVPPPSHLHFTAKNFPSSILCSFHKRADDALTIRIAVRRAALQPFFAPGFGRRQANPAPPNFKQRTHHHSRNSTLFSSSSRGAAKRRHSLDYTDRRPPSNAVLAAGRLPPPPTRKAADSTTTPPMHCHRAAPRSGAIVLSIQIDVPRAASISRFFLRCAADVIKGKTPYRKFDIWASGERDVEPIGCKRRKMQFYKSKKIFFRCAAYALSSSLFPHLRRSTLSKIQTLALKTSKLLSYTLPHFPALQILSQDFKIARLANFDGDFKLSRLEIPPNSNLQISLVVGKSRSVELP
ncbi:hypothetical protein R3P38DRAFT_3346170 [Favolaschia claudopus]|uniref:Uncharacterized protein n=1 Tax=Favolaschia claudopus TaxID=2862362 RepID=A0AAW0D606_9AGAR